MSKNDSEALFQYINTVAARTSKQISGDKPIVTGTILASTPGRYSVQIANGNENTPVDAVTLNSNDTFKKDDYVYLLKSEVASGDLFEFKYFIFGLVDETKEEFYNLTDWERFSQTTDGLIIQSNENEKTLENSQKMQPLDEWIDSQNNNTYLSSISLSNGSIQFNKDVKEYSINVD